MAMVPKQEYFQSQKWQSAAAQVFFSLVQVVAPTIQNPSCQEQLVEAAKQVAKSVDGVVETAQNTCNDENSLGDLNAAATAVSKALNDLLDHIKHGAHGQKGVDEVDTILTATDRLFSSMGDTPEMVKQARILAQVTAARPKIHGSRSAGVKPAEVSDNQCLMLTIASHRLPLTWSMP